MRFLPALNGVQRAKGAALPLSYDGLSAAVRSEKAVPRLVHGEKDADARDALGQIRRGVEQAAVQLAELERRDVHPLAELREPLQVEMVVPERHRRGHDRFHVALSARD